VSRSTQIGLGSLTLASFRGGNNRLELDFQRGLYALNGSYQSDLLSLPGFTYSRTGAATAADLSGGVVNFAANAPRRTDAGLLFETVRTNFIRRSQDLDNVLWIPTGTVTRTANHALAPDGTMTATRVQQGPAASLIGDVATGAPTSTPVIVSFWAKGVSAGQIIATRSGASGAAVPHTLTTSWQRFTWAFTSHATAEVLQFANNGWGGGTSTAAATQDAHIWGAQFEVGTTVSSYIPTAGASVARGLDVAAVTVPSGVSTYTALYGTGAGTTVSGSVTPGASFDLVTGRPWLGSYLRRLTMR